MPRKRCHLRGEEPLSAVRQRDVEVMARCTRPRISHAARCFASVRSTAISRCRPRSTRNGPLMISLMMQGWGQGGVNFNQARQRFMRALEEGGHAPRGQKQYGTLLAC